VNDDLPLGKIAGTRTMNCANCAIATDASIAGSPASALPGEVTRVADLTAVYDKPWSGSMADPGGDGGAMQVVHLVGRREDRLERDAAMIRQACLSASLRLAGCFEDRLGGVPVTEFIARDENGIDVFASLKPRVREALLCDGGLSRPIRPSNNQESRARALVAHRGVGLPAGLGRAAATRIASSICSLSFSSASLFRRTASSRAARMTSASSSSVGSVSGAMRSRCGVGMSDFNKG
jgi:hypothetical protein